MSEIVSTDSKSSPRFVSVDMAMCWDGKDHLSEVKKWAIALDQDGHPWQWTGHAWTRMKVQTHTESIIPK